MYKRNLIKSFIQKIYYLSYMYIFLCFFQYLVRNMVKAMLRYSGRLIIVVSFQKDLSSVSRNKNSGNLPSEKTSRKHAIKVVSRKWQDDKIRHKTGCTQFFKQKYLIAEKWIVECIKEILSNFLYDFLALQVIEDKKH